MDVEVKGVAWKLVLFIIAVVAFIALIIGIQIKGINNMKSCNAMVLYYLALACLVLPALWPAQGIMFWFVVFYAFKKCPLVVSSSAGLPSASPS
jgi:hypothetical protein